MKKKQVVDINFYRDNNLPIPLKKEAEKQGIEIKEGLMAVKTLAGSPTTYEFIMIGKTQYNLKNFFYELAKDDGIDLNKVALNLMK